MISVQVDKLFWSWVTIWGIQDFKKEWANWENGLPCILALLTEWPVSRISANRIYQWTEQLTTRLLMHASKVLWTYPPQVFTSVHLLNKIVRSRFTISSPFFSFNNWVKIHCCKSKVEWRFTKLICFF